MKPLSKYSIIFVASCLTACSYHTVKDHDSPSYSVPVGSTLTLNKKITIPANLARRFFQNGKPIKKRDINIYYPHCSLLMNTLVDHERTIEPASYEIYKVIDDEEYALRLVYFASLTITAEEGPSIIGYTSYYYLRSADDLDVRSLECTQWGYPADTNYLTINEVKHSLGDYFTLQINHE